MRIELLLPIALLVSGCESPKPAKSPTSEASNSPPDKEEAKSDAMPIEAFEAPGLGDPEIEIVNPTNRAMTVVLSGTKETRVEVPAMQSRPVKVAAGGYSIVVQGEDPSSAEPAKFDLNWRYRVVLRTFYEMDEPRYVGKGLECVPVAGLVQYYLCGRTKHTCEIYRNGMPPEIKVAQCTHFDSLFGFRADLPEGVFDGFTSTAGECETFRADYLKRHPGATATACKRTE